MLHRVVLKPDRMLDVLPTVDEGLFVIRCHLTKKTYQVVLYKYNNDYFLLQNPSIIHLLLDKPTQVLSNDYLLGLIEYSMECNYYQLTSLEWVALDMSILKLKGDLEIEMVAFDD